MALAGYPLKLDYGDAAGEAKTCRTDCALFDFSFLECVRVAGPNARVILEAFAGRSLKQLHENKIFYALRVDSTGHALADLTIWRTGPASFEVMSGRREDADALLDLAKDGLAVQDLSLQRAVFSVQGPRSLTALSDIGDLNAIAELSYFAFVDTALAGIPCVIGRLGYTGERGFEILAPRAHAEDLWRALSRRARLAGFTAADLLRIEAGFVLFMNEFALPVLPEEAGLAQFHRTSASQKPQVRLVSFCAEAGPRAWPWSPSRPLLRPNRPEVITVTSACVSIIAGRILGLGYVHTDTPPDAEVVDPTSNFLSIRLAPRPFYEPAKTRPREPWVARHRL